MELVSKEVNELLNKELSATEVKKEDNIYYNMAGWVIADSFVDILKNKFSLIGAKYEVNFEGDKIDPLTADTRPHKKLWSKYQEDYEGKGYNYFPRFRANVYNGVLYINIHSRINLPHIINGIIKETKGENLELEIECNDSTQGIHYEFELK